MPPAILADQLTKHFRTKVAAPGLLGSLRAVVRPTYRETVAMEACSFQVQAGEVVAFIGPNGAGKSTTIKMLTGILYPSGGTARVLGLVPWEQRTLLAYNIAAVFGQKSQLWYHLAPRASFELLARVYDLDGQDYRRRVAELVDLFEIGPHLDTPVRRLSLGERMRCELAAALLHRPRIVFLDEPTIGLDVIAKQRIRGLIRRLNEENGVTVFLTSHDADDIEQLCQRVLVVNHGRLILDEPMATLKHEFLRTKVVELRLHEAVGGTHGEGATAGVVQSLDSLRGVVCQPVGEWTVRLEVDTTVQPIEQVIARLVGTGRVADLTISDPPMEEIIAQIYTRRPASPAEATTAPGATPLEPLEQPA